MGIFVFIDGVQGCRHGGGVLKSILLGELGSFDVLEI